MTSSRTFLNQHIEKENQLATKTLTITQSDKKFTLGSTK